VRHPNIGAAISYHTHSGVILRPMGTQSDDDMIPEDLWTFKPSARSAPSSRLPGHQHLARLQVHPRTSSAHAGLVYEHLRRAVLGGGGLVAEQGAGITDYKWIDWFREPPGGRRSEAAEVERRATATARPTSTGIPFSTRNWGQVEIGGWDKMNFWRNPPSFLREREAARFPQWMNKIALSLPKLELLRSEVAHRPDTWRIGLAVANSGYAPT